MTVGSPLLIVGASTRAAAESAIRAGFAPICAGLFADADLRAMAEVLPVSDYPHGLIAATANVPRDVPLLYTGAIENHPRLLATLCRDRPLIGNGPAVLRRVRDPFAVHEVLAAHGLPALDVMPGDVAPPAGDWLWKPLRGSAGRAISRARANEPGYWQRFQSGNSCSALFFAGDSRATLIGVACQLIGPPHLAFGFAGAIAPFPVPPATHQALLRLGNVLRDSFALTGLFGVDFILHDDRPWLVEINPRCTATVELFEFACRQPLLISAPVAECTTNHCFGKRILYAESRLVAGDLTRHIRTTVSFDRPLVADIPEPGQVIEPGQPICTVYAEADEVDACVRSLDQAAADVLRAI